MFLQFDLSGRVQHDLLRRQRDLEGFLRMSQCCRLAKTNMLMYVCATLLMLIFHLPTDRLLVLYKANAV